MLPDYCHGESCHSRALFLVICKYVIELYSKAFFKHYLFECVLAMTSDPVPNIRLRTCSLLPDLKRLIKLPYDNNLKTSLEHCIRKILVNEKDKDVLYVMKQVLTSEGKCYFYILKKCWLGSPTWQASIYSMRLLLSDGLMVVVVVGVCFYLVIDFILSNF